MNWFNVLKISYEEELAALSAQIKEVAEEKKISGIKCPNCGGRNVKCWNQKRKGGKVTSYTGVCECFDGCTGEIDNRTGKPKNHRWSTKFNNSSIPDKVDTRRLQSFGRKKQNDGLV